MTDRTLIAIDPGVTGAIAVRVGRSGGTTVFGMPDGLVALDQFFVHYIQRLVRCEAEGEALLENVGFHRPGNSAVASCTFARHCGALEMALISRGIPYTKVTPSKWMHDMYGDALPKEKKERKEYIYQQVVKTHPELTKVHKYQADALGMLDYMIKMEGQRNEV
jgi:hypothetical protein